MSLFSSFPGHAEIKTRGVVAELLFNMVAEDDAVAVFLLTKATHNGEFRGVPPTGNDITVEDAGLIRIEDRRIVELWPQSDMLCLFEQLGVSLER